MSDVRASPHPVKRKKLYEDVVDQIESMIRSGALPAGGQLPAERELMALFGVGRNTVREALFALQRNGLVSIRNGERASVTVPSARGLIEEMSAAARHMLASPEGMRDFQQARAIMECSMARHAAVHVSGGGLASLERALARNEAAVGDLIAFSETDVAFHYEITRIAGNAVFDALHQASARWLGEQRLISLRDGAAERDALRAHRAIFSAIASRDPDLAERAMRAHLDAVSAVYWAQVGAPSP